MSEESWAGTYFNYFTEIEEHFQRARGTSLFLMSPLDWALVEGWKNTGVPLEAVLRGIDDAFEKYNARKKKTAQQVNSLSYCAQAVTKAAEEILNNRPQRKGPPTAEESLPNDALRAELESRIPELEAKGFSSQAEAVRQIVANFAAHHRNLEELEQHLSANRGRTPCRPPGSGRRITPSSQPFIGPRTGHAREEFSRSPALRPARRPATKSLLPPIARAFV